MRFGARKSMVRLMICTVLLSIMWTTAVHAVDKITQKDMIYFVFTDRFFDGDPSNNQKVNKEDPNAYHGGDFQGIIDKLDYIKGLGFTTIWISPVVQNEAGGYHGYWTSDFYKTNEHFGTMKKLKELVETAHEKDIKVMFDLVVNHTGYKHPWLSEENNKDWFHEDTTINDVTIQTELENGWLSGLPDLNTEKTEVRRYLIDMAKWWIKETNIDGYRLDTVRHVPKDFWTQFSTEIKKEYPDFFLMGEVFNEDIDYVSGYQKVGIDGLFDFATYEKINAVFRNDRSAESLAKTIINGNGYKNRQLMGTFMDNHDVQRFANNLSSMPEKRVESALAFMMTYTGIPVLYYGDEIGMQGGADPENRHDMNFDTKSQISEYLKKLTRIRMENPALTEGNIEVLHATPTSLSYARKYKGNIILTVFNASTDKQTLEFRLQDKYSGDKLTELLSQTEQKVSGGVLKLVLSPMAVQIFRVENDNRLYVYGFIAVDLIIITAVFVVVKVRKKNRKRN